MRFCEFVWIVSVHLWVVYLMLGAPCVRLLRECLEKVDVHVLEAGEA